MDFDTPLAPKSMAYPAKYAFHCRDCDTKWRDSKQESDCFSCERRYKCP